MAADKHRLQLDLSPAALETLDQMKKRLDAPTRAEVVRRALHLLDYVSARRGSVVLRGEDGVERIIDSL